jgi:hypothetical protein
VSYETDNLDMRGTSDWRCKWSTQAVALKPGGGLNDTKCKTLWTIISPNGATISKDTAVPYIANFAMVDIDNEETIDANEFISGCKAGLDKAQ